MKTCWKNGQHSYANSIKQHCTILRLFHAVPVTPIHPTAPATSGTSDRCWGLGRVLMSHLLASKCRSCRFCLLDSRAIMIENFPTRFQTHVQSSCQPRKKDVRISYHSESFYYNLWIPLLQKLKNIGKKSSGLSCMCRNKKLESNHSAESRRCCAQP